jgi:hypothetical protein
MAASRSEQTSFTMAAEVGLILCLLCFLLETTHSILSVAPDCQAMTREGILEHQYEGPPLAGSMCAGPPGASVSYPRPHASARNFSKCPLCLSQALISCGESSIVT